MFSSLKGFMGITNFGSVPFPILVTGSVISATLGYAKATQRVAKNHKKIIIMKNNFIYRNKITQQFTLQQIR